MTEYFVRPSGASDDLGAGTFADPWQTLGKAASFAYSPGDYVFVEDTTYREFATFTNGGTADDPVRIRTYELNGGRPVISGADVLGSWSAYDTNQWGSSVSQDPLQTFVDGVRATKVGTAVEVDGPGKWYYDAGALEVVVYSVGAPTETWEASSRSSCVRFNASYFDIEGFECRHTRSDGIIVPDSSLFGCAFRDMYVHDHWRYGLWVVGSATDTVISGGRYEDNNISVFVAGSNGTLIEQVEVYRTIQLGGKGIFMSVCDDTKIRKCIVAGFPNGNGAENGIEIGGITNTNWEIRNCRVTDSRVCINVSTAAQGRIERNQIGGGVGSDVSPEGVILRAVAGESVELVENIIEGDFGTRAAHIEAIEAGGSIVASRNRISGTALAFSVAVAAAGGTRTMSGNRYATTDADIIDDGAQTIPKVDYGLWLEQHPADLP